MGLKTKFFVRDTEVPLECGHYRFGYVRLLRSTPVMSNYLDPNGSVGG